MNELREPTEGYDEPGLYEIRIKGHLDDRWAGTFEGLTLTREDNGVTCLAGEVADQAALHGLLRAVRNLGVPLLSVIHAQSEPSESPNGRPRNASHRSTKEAHT
ncbi:MAG: hypothetical protein M3Z66_00825 [Chloroflexota bacterium]|nr:hypothetical protein [Chloroflexota bacterium]